MNSQQLSTQPIQLSRQEQLERYTVWSDRIFGWFVYGFVFVFVLMGLLPFWLALVASFTPEPLIARFGFQLFPQQFTLAAYDYVLQGHQILQSYSVTLFNTGVGTALGMAITTPFAYVMASRKARLSGCLSFMTYFTMIFGGGIIGLYMLVALWLDLRDNIWAMVLPYLFNPFYAFVLVAYFRTIPPDILDAAVVDGANDLQIFWKIALPLAKPALASVSLFYALRYWNDWWLSLLFINDPNLHSLQVMIRQLYSNTNAAQYLGANSIAFQEAIPTYGVQMATVVLTIGPIIVLYPFLQRYFVKGLTIGAVKG